MATIEIETAVSHLTEWQNNRKELDREFQTLNNKIKNAERRLYSGNVQNTKELADLQHQIEAMGRHRSSMEDTILEAMIMVEQAFEVDEDDAIVTDISCVDENGNDAMTQEMKDYMGV